jgi:hypothetical protein
MIMTTQFEAINQQNDRKNKYIGLGITIGFHIIIAFILMFVMLKIPNPPFPESLDGGIEVDYGTDNTGTGDVEPMKNDDPSLTAGNTNQNMSNGSNDVKAAVASATSPAANNLSDHGDVEVNDVKKVDSKVVKETSSTTTAKSTNAAPVISLPTVNKNALFSSKGAGNGNGPTGTNTNPGAYSQGVAGGPGNQGDPNGTKSNVYKGTAGFGGDKDFKLDNRSCTYKHKPTVDCNENGVVVVKIRVGKNGRVSDAKFTQAGSSTTNSCLVKAAETAAMKWQFNNDDDANDVAVGYITFVYKER